MGFLFVLLLLYMYLQLLSVLLVSLMRSRSAVSRKVDKGAVLKMAIKTTTISASKDPTCVCSV